MAVKEPRTMASPPFAATSSESTHIWSILRMQGIQIFLQPQRLKSIEYDDDAENQYDRESGKLLMEPMCALVSADQMQFSARNDG